MDSILSDSIKLDYLSFTTVYSQKSFDSIHSLFDNVDSEVLPGGAMGYTNSMVVAGTGRIYWNPDRKDMGVHVSLGSNALGQVQFTPLGLLNRVIDIGGRFSRIDLAFDDFDGLLDLDLMHKKLQDGEVVTRWRKVLRTTGGKVGSDRILGDTVAVGRRTSDSYLRMYDKKKEQEAKKKDVTGIKTWVRVELELKSDKADVVARMLAEIAVGDAEKDVGELCSSLLYGLIDFKDVNEEDKTKSRWETSEFWRDFVGNVGKETLSITRTSRTLDESKDWVQKAVSTTLGMIILAEPDDNGQSGYDFIMACIIAGSENLSKGQQRKLSLYNQQQREKSEEIVLPTK